MNNEDFIWVPCRVLDKEKKSGFFKDTYFMTMKIENENLTLIKGGRTFKVPVNIENFYEYLVGETPNIKFYKKPNGNYTPQKNNIYE